MIGITSAASISHLELLRPEPHYHGTKRHDPGENQSPPASSDRSVNQESLTSSQRAVQRRTDNLNSTPKSHEQSIKENLELDKTETDITTEKLNSSMGDHSLVSEKKLTLMEKLEIQRLEQLERSVREHERSHMRAAQGLALGGPSYDYEYGPDGRKYAVGGEVNIDASISASDAEETIEKALRIQHAALAPSDPSPKDRQAANQARIIESKAHRKLSREESLEVTLKDDSQDPILKNLPDNLNPYKQNIELQRNLSNMLDLFT